MPVDDPVHNRLHPSHVDRPVFVGIAITEHHAERVVVIPRHPRRRLMRRGYTLEELTDRHIVGLLHVEGIRVSHDVLRRLPVQDDVGSRCKRHVVSALLAKVKDARGRVEELAVGPPRVCEQLGHRQPTKVDDGRHVATNQKVKVECLQAELHRFDRLLQNTWHIGLFASNVKHVPSGLPTESALSRDVGARRVTGYKQLPNCRRIGRAVVGISKQSL